MSGGLSLCGNDRATRRGRLLGFEFLHGAISFLQRGSHERRTSKLFGRNLCFTGSDREVGLRGRNLGFARVASDLGGSLFFCYLRATHQLTCGSDHGFFVCYVGYLCHNG